MKLFDAVPDGTLARHTVDGFPSPIPAVCYAGDRLRSPFPMGGLATGYLELRGDGHTGLCSIFNEFVPPRETSGPLLTLIDASGSTIPLDAEHCEISVLAHFPVCNVRYRLESGLNVWLRAFSPLIPGDAEISNTPGILFEVSLDGAKFDGRLRLEMALEKNPFGAKAIEAIQVPGMGFRAVLADGGNRRGDLTLCWSDAVNVAESEPEEGLVLAVEAQVQTDDTVHAVFAWHVPWFKDSGGEPHQHRYGTRFRDSVAVARLLSEKRESLLHRVLAWQHAIYAADLPDWIGNALVQSLYSHVKNTLWVDERRNDRWYEPEGLFVHSESFRGCPITETMVCRQHGHLPLLLLWPELERTTLAAFAHFQLRDGEVPFSFGQPTALRDPRYHCQHPLDASQFIQQVHRYLARSGDETFARRIWPHVVDAMRYGLRLDADGDGLIDEHSHALPGENWPANQFYDIWPWYGTSAYVAGTWLAALCAAQDLARRLDDLVVLREATALLEQGLASYREKLWNGEYFRLYNDDVHGADETCLANQLIGQWCCRIAGLDPLFDASECESVYQAITRHNAVTDYGIINGGNFQGEVNSAGIGDTNNHGTMIFFGENLCACMTGMYEGCDAAAGWAERLVWTIHEHEAMPFDQHCLLRHDNGEPAWGRDYYSNLVVWALPMAHHRIGLAEYTAPDSLIDHILTAGR